MRRIRLLLAALSLGLLVTLGFSAPASAADLGDDEKCMVETARERLGIEDDHAELTQAQLNEVVADEDAASDFMACHEAPNPLVPALYEVFWGAFGLAVVMIGMWKFALPAMRTTLDARAEKIRGDIEAAETARSDAEGILAKYESELANARSESARIIEEARQSAEALKADRVAAIEPELADLREKAAADIASAKESALNDLRGEITAIAIGAAERVVERNLDDATNRALIDSYIDSVGTKS